MTERRLFIPDHIVWQDVPGELALFDAHAGTYHALNASAAAIWRALAAGLSEAEATRMLAEHHMTSRHEMAEAVAAFVRDAKALGLVEAA